MKSLLMGIFGVAAIVLILGAFEQFATKNLQMAPVVRDGEVFCSNGYQLGRSWQGFLLCEKQIGPNGTMIPHDMQRNPAAEV